MRFLQKLFLRQVESRRVEEMLAKDRVEGVSQRMVCAGNIFRVLSQQTEFNMHKKDLQNQLDDLAETHAAVLDKSNTPLLYPDAEVDTPAQRRYQQLLYLLDCANVEVVGTESYGLSPGSGFTPITEFVSGGRLSLLGGIVVYPVDGFQKWMKMRLMGFLLCIIMTFGPTLIFTSDAWIAAKNFQSADLQTWKGISAQMYCAVDVHDVRTTFVTTLATLFLVVIYEVVRVYINTEIMNAELVKALPANRFWGRMGQITNLVCCVMTVFALPVVFATEMFAKDIVFDSLGLLFIFTIDDLTSDALGGFNIDDDSFRQDYTWMVSLLGCCPVEIKDVTNPRAETAGDIFRFRLDNDGLLTASGGRCFCRLMDNSDAVDESSPLLKVPERSRYKTPTCFVPKSRKSAEETFINTMPFPSVYLYTRTPGSTSELPGKFLGDLRPMEALWKFFAIVVEVAVVIIPMLFFFFSKPCVNTATAP